MLLVRVKAVASRIVSHQQGRGFGRNFADGFSQKGVQVSRAFTLIELMITIALIAFIYTVALPNFTGLNQGRVADKLGRLNADIRSAFDQSILKHQPLRLVFHLQSGEYWLEETQAEQFYLGDRKEHRDLSPSEEKDKRAQFDEDFKKYKTLLGDSVKDPDKDAEVWPVSPVVSAKTALELPKWSVVSSLEWRKRELSPELIIKDIRTEHLAQAVNVEEEPDAVAYLYFFPSGYVERMRMHIYKRRQNAALPDSKPYTLESKPWQGEGYFLSDSEEELSFEHANPYE